MVETEIRLPKRPITHEDIGNACWNFSDLLTNGSWSIAEVRHASIERSIGEHVIALIRKKRDMPKPVFAESTGSMVTNVSFHADKDEYMVDFPVYEICHSVGHEVLSTELNPALVERILRENDGGEEAYTDLLKGTSEEEFSDINETGLLTRKMEHGYSIEHDGFLVGYDVAVSYYLDEDSLITDDYSIGWNGNDLRGEPTAFDDQGFILESKPESVGLMSASTIGADLRNIDEQWRDFLVLHALAEDINNGDETMLDHNRRVLSLMALAASPMLTVRQLLRR
tara:strand:+ start:78 stop:926 length:849 start_codon:yes stop_codon:yes gene_type:complete